MPLTNCGLFLVAEMLSLFHHSGTINGGVANDMKGMLKTRFRAMDPPLDKAKYPNITKQYGLNRREFY